MRTLILAAGIAGLAASPTMAAERAAATMMGTDGQNIGSALLEQTPHGVVITLTVNGLPAGVHAVHIHETGQCDAQGGFQSAGGHYNPDSHDHGYEAEGGPHAGDLPNAIVQEDGALSASYHTDAVSLDENAETTLFDDDGSALVVHADEDDYSSQPSGAAGDRLACGVIEAQ